MFEKMYLTKELRTEPTAAMQKGKYFEYLVTGDIPKDGIPEPELLKSGDNKGKPVKEWQRVINQAANVKRCLEYHQIEILAAGTVLETIKDGVKYKGILDILANFNGRKCIIDLKYSGLVDNKWEDRGWHEETFPNRPKLHFQTIFYKYLWWLIYGEEIDFYFLVADASSESNYLFWKASIPLQAVIEKTKKAVLFAIEVVFGEYRHYAGFPFASHYDLCAACPWVNLQKGILHEGAEHTTCPKRRWVQNMKEINITTL